MIWGEVGTILLFFLHMYFQRSSSWSSPGQTVSGPLLACSLLPQTAHFSLHWTHGRMSMGRDISSHLHSAGIHSSRSSPAGQREVRLGEERALERGWNHIWEGADCGCWGGVPGVTFRDEMQRLRNAVINFPTVTTALLQILLLSAEFSSALRKTISTFCTKAENARHWQIYPWPRVLERVNQPGYMVKSMSVGDNERTELDSTLHSPPHSFWRVFQGQAVRNAHYLICMYNVNMHIFICSLHLQGTCWHQSGHVVS